MRIGINLAAKLWLLASSILQLGSGWAFFHGENVPLGVLLHLLACLPTGCLGPQENWSKVLVIGLPWVGAPLAFLTILMPEGQGLVLEPPSHAEVARGLGQSRQQRERAALRLEDNCDQSTHDVARVRHLSQSGPSLLLRNKVEELRRILQFPKNPAYHLAKSEWNKLQEDYTRRLAGASEALTRARLSREFAESGLLESSMASFYLDQSQQQYQSLTESPEAPQEAWLELAELLVARQRYAQASQLLQRAGQRFPDRADWLLRQLEVSYYACQKLSPPPLLDLINTAWDYAQREAVEEPDEAAQYWRTLPSC